jgi:hypothetical protein
MRDSDVSESCSYRQTTSRAFGDSRTRRYSKGALSIDAITSAAWIDPLSGSLRVRGGPGTLIALHLSLLLIGGTAEFVGNSLKRSNLSAKSSAASKDILSRIYYDVQRAASDTNHVCQRFRFCWGQQIFLPSSEFGAVQAKNARRPPKTAETWRVHILTPQKHFAERFHQQSTIKA